MKIILTLNNYSNLTGSELYVYELSKELHKRGHDVCIIAQQIGGVIAERTDKAIERYNFFVHPDMEPDLVISSQPMPTSYALRFFPKAKHMQILHSVLIYEEPVISDLISCYIAVRPEIKKHWIEKYPNVESKVAVIWNGVDTDRFKPSESAVPNEKKTILFVGTFDHLRRNVIMDLVKEATQNDTILRLVSSENPFGDDLPRNVYYSPTHWNVEDLVKECDETAGIFVGRTTIEGFMCGKPAIVYDVDERGNILRKMSITVPENTDIFDIRTMTDKLLAEYEAY